MVNNRVFAIAFLLINALESVISEIRNNPRVLRCQPKARNLKFYLLHDLTSASMKYFKNVADSISNIESMLAASTYGSSQEIEFGLGFANHYAIPGGEASCFQAFCPLSTGNVCTSDFSPFVNLSGSDVDGGNILRSLYGLSNLQWSESLKRGRKVIMLFAGSLPDEPDKPDFASFSEFVDNDVVDCFTKPPSISDVLDDLEEAGVHLLIFTTPALIERYLTKFYRAEVLLGVYELSTDSNVMQSTMITAFNDGACGPEIPLVPLGDPDGSIDCNQMHLQMLHIQDFSYSYTDELDFLKASMPTVIQHFRNHFHSVEMGLVTFVDKPVLPSGYDYDYCYREDVIFTTDEKLYFNGLHQATVLSGKDWKESQLDALKYGLRSSTLGWEFNNIGNQRVYKIVILATDSAAHTSGDLTDVLPPTSSEGCALEDYPTYKEINHLFRYVQVYPIFIVTKDVMQYWKYKVATEFDGLGVVLALSSDLPITDHINAEVGRVCEQMKSNQQMIPPYIQPIPIPQVAGIETY